jgi:hypothetical protein
MGNPMIGWCVGFLALLGGGTLAVWSLVGARGRKRVAPRKTPHNDTAPIIAMPLPLPPAPIELAVLGPIEGTGTTDFAVDTAVTTSIGDDIIASIESARMPAVHFAPRMPIPASPPRARLASGSVAPLQSQTPRGRGDQLGAMYGSYRRPLAPSHSARRR